MSGGSDFFGWDLLHRTVEVSIHNEADILIAFVHWFLTRNASFRCIGVGDDKTLPESAEQNSSELLPDGWNDSSESYALRYVVNSTLYILLATKIDDTLVINLLDAKSRNVSNLALTPSETVKTLKGPLLTMIPEASLLMERIKKELSDPVFTGTTKEGSTQTQGHSSTQSHSTERQPSQIPFADPLRIYPGNRRIDPLRDIGRGDLDPLGRGGGGMLFPSPGAPGGPLGPFGGPFQPTPRFDPFGPVDPDMRRNRNFPNPNPDHIRPPSEFDNMFM